MIGQTISHYRILEKLGGGGMGVVYKAEDTKLGRLVALKFLSEPLVGDNSALERFQREARTASALDHPNICTIYEIGEHAGLPFIAMQYLEGQTLDQRVRGKPLPVDEVVELGIQIADALEAAHAVGIIHRDIKPANIFVTRRGQAKILDFGIAKLSQELRTGASGLSGKPPTTVDAVFTIPGAQVGTLAYMSPEQERGEELDVRSDLFSFGLVLYDMATGWNSLSDKVASVIHDAVCGTTAKSSAPKLPPGLGAIIEKASQVDRDRRYQSAAEMSADLKRLKREVDSAAKPPGGATVPLAPSDRHAELPVARAARRVQPVERRAAIKLYLERFLLALFAGLVTTSIMAMLTAKISVFAGVVAIGSIAILAFLAVIVAEELTREAESGPSAVVSLAPAAQEKQRIAGWKLALSAGVVAIAISAGLFYSHGASALTEKDTIILADFDNKTGDPVFDDTLKQALAVDLGQSPFLNIFSDRKMAATLRLMGRSPDQPVTGEVARDLCQRAGSKVMLTGSISALGNNYVIGLNAINCASGDALIRHQVEARGKEDVLKALGNVATDMRQELGESLTSVQKFATPIEEATTSSLEALKAYSMGRRAFNAKGDVAAIPYYQQAVELDASFAMAYSALAVSYFTVGQGTRASEDAKKAFELRERVSEREKYRISAAYYAYATGELDKAGQAYDLWKESYPRDYLPIGNLGDVHMKLGQWEKALAETEELGRLEPNSATFQSNLIFIELALNRTEDARAAVQQALARKLDSYSLRLSIYETAFVGGDQETMQQQLTWAVGRPREEDWLLSAQSDTEAYFGRLANAREFSRRALESALRAQAQETASLWQVNAALREAEFGNPSSAVQDSLAALARAPGRNVLSVAALALGRAGEMAQAQKLAEALNKDFPQDTIVQGYWLSSIRAADEINRKNYARAVEILQTAAPYELGQCEPFQVRMLYPIYLRGHAYLTARRGKEAVAEFQRIIEHRGITTNFPLGALAHLQIG